MPSFLDAENGKPDNAKNLRRMVAGWLISPTKDGFFGDSGGELLTLDGKGLKSDASIPNKSGSKDTQLPISMQSVRMLLLRLIYQLTRGDFVWHFYTEE